LAHAPVIVSLEHSTAKSCIPSPHRVDTPLIVSMVTCTMAPCRAMAGVNTAYKFKVLKLCITTHTQIFLPLFTHRLKTRRFRCS
jgi:hypothetical protein